jgi:hypothetical protein
MDFLKQAQEAAGKYTQGQGQQGQQQHDQSTEGQQSNSSGGGFLGSLGDKFNSAAGGGKESEKNEDYLDKGVDFVQEKFLGAGPQDNESAVEQAKDEQISDFIRSKYKETTGKVCYTVIPHRRFGSVLTGYYRTSQLPTKRPSSASKQLLQYHSIAACIKRLYGLYHIWEEEGKACKSWHD